MVLPFLEGLEKLEVSELGKGTCDPRLPARVLQLCACPITHHGLEALGLLWSLLGHLCTGMGFTSTLGSQGADLPVLVRKLRHREADTFQPTCLQIPSAGGCWACAS